MSLLQMSRSGAVLILVIVVIRALAIHKLPKKAFLVLWGVVAVRLLIPYSLPSAISIYSLLGRLVPAAEEIREMPASTLTIPAYHVTPMPETSAVHTASVPMNPWTVVWLVGGLICAVFFVMAYLKCRREFKASLPIDNEYAKHWLGEHRIYRTIEIRQSGRISAPLTYGVFHPVILMPKTADWNDLDTLNYVLTHEYVHIRRFDAVTKLVLTVALCVHWFNPAVWIMYVLANRDIELSCDEAVIRQFGERTKSAYAMTLIRLEETRNSLTPLCNNFSKNAIEERIIAIMKTKKTSLAALLIAAALVVGVTTAFATSAKTDENLLHEDLELLIYKYASTICSGDVSSYIELFTDENQRNMNEYLYEFGQNDFFREKSVEVMQLAKLSTDTGILSAGLSPTEISNYENIIVYYAELLIDRNMEHKAFVLVKEDDKWKILRVSTPDLRPIVGTADFSLDAETYTIPETAQAAEETEVLLKAYVPFGLAYEIDPTTGELSMSWQGKPVHSVFDAEKSVWIANSLRGLYLGPDAVDLEAVYERDNLTGLRETQPQQAHIIDSMIVADHSDVREVLPHDVAGIVSYASAGNTAVEPGMSLAERFEKYAPFGITYEEVDGTPNVYYNGQLVGQFADLTSDGGAFTFVSVDQGGVTVKTVYDNNGKLAGVETGAE